MVCLAQPTDVTMKNYVDEKYESNRSYMDAQIVNINENVVRANAAMEKRLDALNEFRGQLKDQASTFITRAELFAWVMGLLGVFFGFSRYMKERSDSSNKSIMSGDKVEVKK